jgi:peroxiredoxin
MLSTARPAAAATARCAASRLQAPASRICPAARLQARRGSSTRVAFQTERQQGATQQIQVGDSLPLDATLYCYDPATDDQKPMKLKDVVGKKTIIFGLPGAFTSVCSSKHLPEYNSKIEELQQAGVDSLVCTSINDAWVMKEWAKHLNVDPHKIKLLADGDGSFHRELGLVQTLPGCGERPLRYSLYAEDGKIKVLNVDEPGPKSYKVSGPNRMLQDLKNLSA